MTSGSSSFFARFFGRSDLAAGDCEFVGLRFLDELQFVRGDLVRPMSRSMRVVIFVGFAREGINGARQVPRIET
jgi:hypothetical protein